MSQSNSFLFYSFHFLLFFFFPDDLLIECVKLFLSRVCIRFVSFHIFDNLLIRFNKQLLLVLDLQRFVIERTRSISLGVNFDDCVFV